MKKLITKFYITTFISEFARTVPHPILIILLIDQKGLSLSQITFIQIFFYLGVLLFEVPSGYLADKGYRKSGYVGSYICMLLAYSLIFISNSVLVLSIGWFIYGIAAALMSGNLDGYIVNLLKQHNMQYKIKSFNVNKTNISLVAGIAGALCGSLLYPVIKTNIYVISIFLYTLAIIVAVFGIRIKHIAADKKLFKITDLEFTSKIKVLILLVCIIELYYVGFYQYWQVLYELKGIPSHAFGLIYIIFSITAIFSNKLYAKLGKINNFIILPIFVFSALSSLFVFDSYIFCLIYPITLFIANLFVMDIYTNLYENVGEESISSMLSIVSTANRIFGIIILAILAVVIDYFDITQILACLYLIFSCSFILIKSKANQ